MDISITTLASPQLSSDPVQVLVEASATLLASPEIASVLPRILALARRLIAADAYAVWRTYDDGQSWRIVAAEGLSPEYQRDLANARGNAMPHSAMAVPDVTRLEMLQDRTDSYAREGIRSMMAVPLMAKGQVSGTIVFYYRTPRDFTEADVRYATTLANLASAALSTADLYEAQLAEKRRSALIAEAATVLASSLNFELTLQAVADLAVSHVADWCVVHQFENDKLTRVAVAAADRSKIPFAEELSRRYPERLNPERGAGKVLRTGEPELVSVVTDDMIAAVAQDEEHLRLIRQLGIVSGITVPLIARGNTVGILRMIAAESGRHYTQDDLTLAQEIARRAAVAIDNARLHRELETANSIMQLTHEAAHVGTWYLDPINKDNNRWSGETYRLSGFPRDWKPDYDEWIARVHPADRVRVHDEIQRALAAADAFTLEYRLQGLDGGWRWHESRGRVHRAENGIVTGLSGITLDVTDRHSAEEALIRSEKLAATGRLAATIAHEINNPLEAVTNLVYLCTHHPELPESIRVYLVTADDELRHVAQIVRQTLGFYREAGNAEPVKIETIVETVLHAFRRRLEAKSIAVRTDLEPDAVAHVISGELKQVIANLLANAIDASTAGSEISIAVTRDATHVQIVIADEGHGISPENRVRLFEPFFTTKKEVGTGLGLWVSRQLVEKHGGSIELSSRTGEEHGTTFTLRMPSQAAKATQSGTA